MSSSAGSGARRFGDGGITLADLGEGALLDRLTEIATQASAGIPAPRGGDDAAVWTPRPGHDLAVSIDALVEDVDYRRGWITPRQLGRRAFAVAVSDLAGTGAAALHCLLTLCVRRTDEVEDVLEIQRGLCAAAAAAGCAVVGGDLSAIDGPMVIDVCVVGEAPTGAALRRNAGRSGDLLVVTGRVGRAAAGLRLLLEGRPLDAAEPPDERCWIDAQLDPPGRLREGQRLLAGGVRCAGDVSDGLAVDAARTARLASCAAELWIDALPVDETLAARFGRDWLQLALVGGEDFELLAAVPGEVLEDLVAAWPANLAPLTVVGRLVDGDGLRLLTSKGGDRVVPPPALSAHFS